VLNGRGEDEASEPRGRNAPNEPRAAAVVGDLNHRRCGGRWNLTWAKRERDELASLGKKVLLAEGVGGLGESLAERPVVGAPEADAMMTPRQPEVVAGPGVVAGRRQVSGVLPLKRGAVRGHRRHCRGREVGEGETTIERARLVIEARPQRSLQVGARERVESSPRKRGAAHRDVRRRVCGGADKLACHHVLGARGCVARRVRVVVGPWVAHDPPPRIGVVPADASNRPARVADVVDVPAAVTPRRVLRRPAFRFLMTGRYA